MEVFKWIALIMGLVIGGEVIKLYIKSKFAANEGNQKVNDQQQQIDALTKRVAVLEELATDPKESLKQQINNLSKNA
ncbi:MAG: hypothetical protein HWE13_03675 [Gammaproteobacteria bacterium]|nr:hypothetical protein [Gammaproteobacteria bacterium]NVK87194.1 hypothetical protein [Gammaproteobacteria bacterium]